MDGPTQERSDAHHSVVRMCLAGHALLILSFPHEPSHAALAGSFSKTTRDTSKLGPYEFGAMRVIRASAFDQI
jgi:hypothetical protein